MVCVGVFMQAIIEDGEFNAYRRSICPETRFRADEHALSTHHEPVRS